MRSALRFRQRLVAVFVAGATLLLALFVALFDHMACRAVEREVERRLLGQARLAARWAAGSELDAGAASSLAALTGTRVTLIDPDGRVLADTGLDAATLAALPPLPARPEIKAARTRGAGVSLRSGDHVPGEAIFAAAALPDGRGFVRLSEPLGAIRAEVHRHSAGIALLGLLGVGAAALAGARLTGPLGRLLRDLTSATRRLGSGDLAARASGTGRADEFGALARAFNHLADELQTRIAELTRERDLMGAILEGMEEGVLVLGPGDTLILANPSLRRMFPRLQALPGEDVSALIRAPGLMEGLEQVRRTGAPSGPREIRVEGPPARDLAVVCAPLGPGAERGVVAVFHDITELKRVERLRRDLVANVSHELRTPLTGIQGFSETLLAGALDDRAVARSFVERIHRQACRLTALVADLLDLARIESGELRLESAPVQVASAVEEAIDTVRARAEAKGLRIAVDLEPQIRLRGDRRAFVHILTNLLANAVDHTDRGSITVSVRRVGDAVRTEVRDTGVGIEAHHLHRIFERFYRVERGRERQDSGGGTGLGLAIAKHLVAAQGGTIGVESAVGVGSTFRFDLPAA